MGGPGCSSGVGLDSRAHGPERQKLTDGRYPAPDAEIAKLTAATAASDNATMKTMATNAVFFAIHSHNCI